MKYRLVLESMFGRELETATATEENLAPVIRRMCQRPNGNCLMINGRGYFSEREALAPLVEVNRYSMANNGARVFMGV